MSAVTGGAGDCRRVERGIARSPAQRQAATGVVECSARCREAQEGRRPRRADRSAVVGGRGTARPGPTVRHEAPIEAGGGGRNAATIRGRNRRRSRERYGLAAAHGARSLFGNPEEEARPHPRLDPRGAWAGLPHCRAGAGMSRAIRDATACREALSRLPQLDLGELRQEWGALYKAEASPHLSRELLVRAVAYRMQEIALGGLGPGRQRQLRQIAQQFKETGAATTPRRSELKAGNRLVREWQGRTYDVLVLDDGFSWQGTHHRSLSAIARKITGTAWSGPLFFGLKPNRSATRRSSQPAYPIDDAMESSNAAG